jgi:hypothetical protein
MAHNTTVVAIRRAFEAAGIQFINGDAPGLRLAGAHKKTLQRGPR